MSTTIPATKIVWSVRDQLHEEVAASLEDLDTLMDRLHDEAKASPEPFIATVSPPSGDWLGVGMGREETTLGYVPANGQPPYYRSAGDPDAEGHLVFFLSGHYTEFPRCSAISMQMARRAIRAFARTGELPDTIRWIEV
jgi:Immunity protein Imm1